MNIKRNREDNKIVLEKHTILKYKSFEFGII